MPLIAYPSVNLGRHPDWTEDFIWTLPVDRTELVLMTPSRQIHENEATRDVVVVNRGPAYWFLTLTFGAVEVGTQEYREYTQWLSRMHDLRNYSNVPIGDYAFKEELNYVAGIDARSIVSISGNTRTLDHPLYWGGTLQGTPPRRIGGTTPVPVGSYIRVDNQIAMLDSISDSGLSFTTRPLIGQRGSFVSLTPTMRCRFAGAGQYRITTTGGMTDPLTIPFVEHIA